MDLIIFKKLCNLEHFPRNRVISCISVGVPNLRNPHEILQSEVPMNLFDPGNLQEALLSQSLEFNDPQEVIFSEEFALTY